MCKETTIWFDCCFSHKPESRREHCSKYWYSACTVVVNETEINSTLCADCKFKRECHEGGIDASAVLEKENPGLFNELQQNEALMLFLMQNGELPADTSEPLLYEEPAPQLRQERRCVPTSKIIGYNDYTVEATLEQHQVWTQGIDFDGLDLGQYPLQRLKPHQPRRQRQTKDTPVSTPGSEHKRKRRSRSSEHDTARKHHKRRKAQNLNEKMPRGLEQSPKEWVVVSQPLQKQGRNVYRIYACQELIAMQQSPQKLSMIARELAQDFALDCVPDQENLRIEASQRRQLYREWRDKSCRGLPLVARTACTTISNNEQTLIVSGMTHSVPVGEAAPSEEDIGRSDAEGIQALDIQQNLDIKQTGNQDVAEEGGQQMQPEVFSMDQEVFKSLNLETMMDAAYLWDQWDGPEQCELPKMSSVEDLDALL
ncbi:hypothetical protein MMC34_004969 [Xylographa carneopallida]|nr:hypothetical protein [Xylographa carneopallida]